MTGTKNLHIAVAVVLDEAGRMLLVRMEYVERMTAPAANEPGFRIQADVFVVELSGVPEIGAEIEAFRWHGKEVSGRVVAPLSQELLRRFAAG